MKGLFLRVDPEIDRRLTEICRQRGLKKGALVTRLIWEFVQMPLATPSSETFPETPEEDDGVDRSLIASNLKLSPSKRLQNNKKMLELVEEAEKSRRRS